MILLARRKDINKLINKNSITEELRKIKDSINAYITPTGNVYLEYEPDKFYKLKSRILFDYEYVAFNTIYGRKNFRVHRLVAQAYIPNPNNLKIVGHKNNIKHDNNINNLYWTTTADNTKKAYDDGLAYNSKSWEDSQSIPIVQLDLDGNITNIYGSISEATKYNNITKSAISTQCKHKTKTIPRKGFYYRYKEEFDKKGFVL